MAPLFPHVKIKLKSRYFEMIKEIQNESQTVLQAVTETIQSVPLNMQPKIYKIEKNACIESIFYKNC